MIAQFLSLCSPVMVSFSFSSNAFGYAVEPEATSGLFGVFEYNLAEDGHSNIDKAESRLLASGEAAVNFLWPTVRFRPSASFTGGWETDSGRAVLRGGAAAEYTQEWPRSSLAANANWSKNILESKEEPAPLFDPSGLRTNWSKQQRFVGNADIRFQNTPETSTTLGGTFSQLRETGAVQTVGVRTAGTHQVSLRTDLSLNVELTDQHPLGHPTDRSDALTAALGGGYALAETRRLSGRAGLLAMREELDDQNNLRGTFLVEYRQDQKDLGIRLSAERNLVPRERAGDLFYTDLVSAELSHQSAERHLTYGGIRYRHELNDFQPVATTPLLTGTSAFAGYRYLIGPVDPTTFTAPGNVSLDYTFERSETEGIINFHHYLSAGVVYTWK